MSDTLRDQLLGLGFKPVPKPDKPAQTSVLRTGDGQTRPGSPSQRPNTDRRGPQRPQGGKPAHDRAASDRPGRDRPAHGRPDPGRQGVDNSAAARRPSGKPASARPVPNRPTQGRPPQGAPRSREDIDLAKAYAIRAQREKDERIAAEKAKQDEARLRREAKLKLAELLKDKALNDPAADIARHFDYGGKIKRIHVTADQLKALNAGELGVVQLDGRYLLVSAALLAEAGTVFAPAVALRIDPDAPAADDPYADPQYQVPDDLVW